MVGKRKWQKDFYKLQVGTIHAKTQGHGGKYAQAFNSELIDNFENYQSSSCQM